MAPKENSSKSGQIVQMKILDVPFFCTLPKKLFDPYRNLLDFSKNFVMDTFMICFPTKLVLPLSHHYWYTQYKNDIDSYKP